MTSAACRSHRRSFRGGNVFWEEWAPHGGLAYERQRPVVLVHGLTDTCRTWNKIAPALARDRRLYALDLPGHGQSSRYDASYDVSWYASLVVEWIRSLGLSDFDLVGHSLGGGIAMHVLLEQPGRVHRLALVAAGGLGLEVAAPLRLAASMEMLDLAAPVLMGLGTSAGLRVLGGNFDEAERKHLVEVNGRPGTARALFRTLRNAVDLRGQREHLLDHAHRLRELPPLAVYWGDRDPVIPVKHAETVHHYLDGAVVRRFPNVGHYPHREAVPEMLSELFRFLDGPQRSPRVRPGARPPRAPEDARPSLWRRLAGARLAEVE
ncbi:alpha/beta fold hydrolase [Polyangium sp. 6x1]|uniref:alpha/beta fold hydrolase n=1 Tax=Polyangium sp. 6x1 TaxID=3042689 RepID=UPI00248311ED|nr:alpha/beta fold hydrolase [Polyangium sp. 6x1]MDI1443409.1 alpha/beta fold hydrolase [Polyangium sp. 6x1]